MQRCAQSAIGFPARQVLDSVLECDLGPAIAGEDHAVAGVAIVLARKDLLVHEGEVFADFEWLSESLAHVVVGHAERGHDVDVDSVDVLLGHDLLLEASGALGARDVVSKAITVTL